MTPNGALCSAAWLIATMIAAVWTPPSQAADLVDRLPANAVVYFGWSNLLEPLMLGDLEPPALTRMLADRFGMPNTAEEPVGHAIEAALTAVKSTGGVAVMVTPKDGSFDVQVAIVVDAGASAEALAGHLDAVLPAVAEAEVSPATFDGLVVRSVPGPDGRPVYWGREGNLVMLAWGEDAARQTSARLKGPGPSLADNAELKKLRAKIQPGGGKWMLCLFADFTRVGVADLIAMAESSGEANTDEVAQMKRAFEASGVGSFRSYYWHVDQNDYGSRSRALLRIEGPERGLVKLYKQAPLTEADLQNIPQDAYWAYASNCDLNGLWIETRQVLEAVDPNIIAQVDGGLSMAQGFLGFSITEHLLPALGDSWLFFDAPSQGGILFSGTVLVCEARDKAAFEAILKRVVELVTPLAMQGQVHLKNKQIKHGEHTIEYVVIGGVPSPVAPAWTMVGDRCLIGLMPQTVAAALDQIDPKRRKSSILDHEDYKAVRANLPKEAMSVTCYNSQFFTRQMYPLVLHALTAGHSFMVPYMPANIAALPSVQQKLEKARLGIGVSSTTPEGAYYEGVGPNDLISSAGLTIGYLGLAAGTLLPAMSKAREGAKHAMSASQLRSLGAAIHAYAADHNDMPPESLEDMVRAGLITRETLTSPFEEPGAMSYTYIDPGKQLFKVQDPANVILAFENDHGGRFEVSVLFVDGHIRRMSFFEAQALVQQAYEQAGRVDEIPIMWRSEPE